MVFLCLRKFLQLIPDACFKRHSLTRVTPKTMRRRKRRRRRRKRTNLIKHTQSVNQDNNQNDERGEKFGLTRLGKRVTLVNHLSVGRKNWKKEPYSTELVDSKHRNWKH